MKPEAFRVARTSLHHPSRLTILKTYRKEAHGSKRQYCLCRCTCGTEKEICKSSIDNGLTRSCGCLHKEVQVATGATSNKTHGDGSRRRGVAREYDAWRSMMKRCYDEKHPAYPSHGGRGITVCQEWRESYENFLANVGRKPTPSHTVDRYPDNNGNYEPGNVRWARPKEQARNRRDNVLVAFNGKTQCASAWDEELSLVQGTVSRRISLGWTVERALTTPVKKYIRVGKN